MKILLVAATSLESGLICSGFPFEKQESVLSCVSHTGIDLTLIHTGIGMVNTAFSLGEYLAKNTPDLAIHFGIAGSFDLEIPLGEVVEIVEDTFSELGAEDGDGFLDLQAMGFPLWESPEGPQIQTLSNPSPSNSHLLKVTGITSNMVHGKAASIEQTKKRWGKQIETMESAAFFLAMRKKGVPFFSFRGISNHVTPRDKSLWKISLAAENVQKLILNMLITDY